MESYKELDNQEKMLLLSGALSLIYTFSFSVNFFKAILGFISYTETGFHSLFFCYINMSVWYCYSVLIEHELMQECYYYSSWIIFTLLILYLSYEYYDDKFDTLLNFLIVLIMHSTIYKVLVQIYDDEEKAKRFCAYTQFLTLIALLNWIYRANKNKNSRDTNIYVSLSLIMYSCSLIVYGEVYQSYFILFSGFAGICVGIVYTAGWFYLNKMYPEPEEDFIGLQSLDIEVKNEKKVNKKKNKIQEDTEDSEEIFSIK
jgi:hypothetical protein